MGAYKSTINICKGVKLSPSYEHTIYFVSPAAQVSYFSGKVAWTFSDYTYLRKNWNIKVQATMDEAVGWSYLYFTNGAKTYYYFVTDVQYISDTVVDLTIEMDVMQTYMFDYQLLPCFVEREHTDNDTPGANIIDEGLDLGDLYINDQFKVDLGDCCVMVLSSFNPITTTEETCDRVMYGNFDGVFSGCGVYAIHLNHIVDWGKQLANFDKWGWADGIMNMWMYPRKLVRLREGLEWGDEIKVKTVAGKSEFAHTINRQNFLQGYEPRNKKLLTYPYNFIYCSTNAGNAGVYKYERFTDPLNCYFICTGSISPDGAAVLYPIDYNGAAQNFEEGLTLAGFPSCAWNSDTYKLWLAQNQNTQALAAGTAVLQVAGGIAMAVGSGGLGAGVGVGMVASGLSQIGSLIATNKDQALQPPQSKGAFSNSVNMAAGFQTFTLQKKSVDKQHAEIIDNYFDMYGYAVRQNKIPNTNVRQHWTYTKTVGCKIKADLNTADILKIESIYNNGVTFWTNGDNISDYSLRDENTIKVVTE